MREGHRPPPQEGDNATIVIEVLYLPVLVIDAHVHYWYHYRPFVPGSSGPIIGYEPHFDLNFNVFSEMHHTYSKRNIYKFRLSK
jgi:hypothetical protein